MKFEISLGTRSTIFGKKESIEKITQEGFTPADITSIVGIDMEDGGAILVSRENWKRLEVFMEILSSVKMSISEKTIKDILRKR